MHQLLHFPEKNILLYRRDTGGATEIAHTDLEVCELIICALKRENHLTWLMSLLLQYMQTDSHNMDA